MFGLFRQKRRRETPWPYRTRPNLERLECRDVPSRLTLSIVPSGVDKTVTVSGDLQSDPVPNGSSQTSTFGGLAAIHTVRFDGVVNSTSVANQVIDLGGVVQGTAITDANGHFTRTLGATGLGTARAWSDDGTSNIATATLAVPPPNIDRLIAVEEPTDWVISGHVTGYNPGSLTITLGGLASVTNVMVAVDADGNFATAVHLNGTAQDDGFLSAVTTDVWGQRSNEALYSVHQTH